MERLGPASNPGLEGRSLQPVLQLHHQRGQHRRICPHPLRQLQEPQHRHRHRLPHEEVLLVPLQDTRVHELTEAGHQPAAVLGQPAVIPREQVVQG